ncbi:MAG TPA: AAA domain-containing protein [Elusimicrobiota bacterium]|nr:AAA domain-containing protein [Elusimicrobiota bacterium]
MAGKEHFERLQVLIDLEREAEKSENLRELRKFPVAQREALGKTVTGLNMDSIEGGMGGMTMIALSRPPKGEELSPFHAMNAGDNVLLSMPPGTEPQAVEGTLYKVEEYRVVVALNAPGPENEPRGSCQIDLLGSDATYQRMRKALVTASESRRSRLSTLREIFLGETSPTRSRVPKIRFFNEGLNEFQQDAVKSALAADDVALVHGPPGTGKTTVLVEIIRQHAARGERVLATAPSNIAVDNILEKLLGSDLRVVRLGHPARTLESLRHANLSAQTEEDPVFERVRELDQTREKLIHRKSSSGRRERAQLGWDERHSREREVGRLWREARDLEFEIQRRIVASAHIVLATHAGMSKRHVKGDFDLVALDEASQATEPLSWVPLTLAKKAIFAGDANQLPPTIYSKEAAEGGLTVTLFDRLKEILPKNVQTLLRVQYRMHENIMKFPSEQFYEGKLLAHESVAKHTADELPGVSATALTSNPVTFIDTAGAGFDESWNDLLESRENKGEAQLAVKILYELLGSGMKPKDVAILTPYVAQAKLLKTMAREPGLEIGSVDGFQGREKEAVILSLVRSNEGGQIGFLGDLRRLNVAITRARRCLIVIGDGVTIARHPVYEKFVAHADALDAHRSSYEWPHG